MFSVNEYYRFNKTFAKTTRHLQRFEALDDAKACADSAYREISRVPESEAIFVAVLDESRDTIIYTLPEEPFAEAHNRYKLTEELWKRWRMVWQPYATEAAGDLVFQALAAAYNAPDRHYHNLAHIADCLETLDACRDDAEDAEAIELALWFHDVVYDTHTADNEEQSAAWAVREIGDGERAMAVHRLILATKHRETPPSGNDDRLITDIDLAILGADDAKFWTYEDAIRREYAWVPEDIFRSKRAEILRRFLIRERIYQTPRFHDKYETTARENLRAAIARLLPEGK